MIRGAPNRGTMGTVSEIRAGLDGDNESQEPAHTLKTNGFASERTDYKNSEFIVLPDEDDEAWQGNRLWVDLKKSLRF